MHTRTGRLDPRGAVAGAARPSSPRRTTRAGRSSARAGALEDVMERFGARLRRHDDITSQALLVVQIVARDDPGRRDRALAEAPPGRAAADRADGAALARRGLSRRSRDGARPLPPRRAVDGGRRAPARSGLRRPRGTRGAAPAHGRALRRLAARLSPPRARGRGGVRARSRWAASPRSIASASCRSMRVRARGVARRSCAISILSPIPIGVRLALGADGARFAFEGFRTLVGKSDSLRRLEPLMAHARKRLGERRRRQGRLAHARLRSARRAPRAPAPLRAASAHVRGSLAPASSSRRRPGTGARRVRRAAVAEARVVARERCERRRARAGPCPTCRTRRPTDRAGTSSRRRSRVRRRRACCARQIGAHVPGSSPETTSTLDVVPRQSRAST